MCTQQVLTPVICCAPCSVLTGIDERFAQLYRLIKTWAGAHGLNDASCSTLNSWSLCMLVIFYLQVDRCDLFLP